MPSHLLQTKLDGKTTNKSGIYFQVDARKELRLIKLTSRFVSKGDVQVHCRAGLLGQTPGEGWKEVLKATVSGPGSHVFPVEFSLSQGHHSILFASSGHISYFGGTTSGAVVAQDDFLTIYAGNGTGDVAPSVAAYNTSCAPRIWDGAIEYDAPVIITPYTHLVRIASAMSSDVEFADVELVCSSSRFPSHRIVLASASPVFAAMLKADMAEARSGKIMFEDEKAETLTAALQFMYQGTIPDDVGHEVITFAHKYEIYGMLSVLGDAILEKLTPEIAPSLVRALRPYKRSCHEAVPESVDAEMSRVHMRLRRSVMNDPTMVEACLDHL